MFEQVLINVKRNFSFILVRALRIKLRILDILQQFLIRINFINFTNKLPVFSQLLAFAFACGAFFFFTSHTANVFCYGAKGFFEVGIE